MHFHNTRIRRLTSSSSVFTCYKFHTWYKTKIIFQHSCLSNPIHNRIEWTNVWLDFSVGYSVQNTHTKIDLTTLKTARNQNITMYYIRYNIVFYHSTHWVKDICDSVGSCTHIKKWILNVAIEIIGTCERVMVIVFSVHDNMDRRLVDLSKISPKNSAPSVLRRVRISRRFFSVVAATRYTFRPRTSCGLDVYLSPLKWVPNVFLFDKRWFVL